MQWTITTAALSNNIYFSFHFQIKGLINYNGLSKLL